ncbi:MAG: DegT/DnrJ/EryC1/StrS family aminotransferase [Clostridiales bacterium]|nr:DegT/DnrJ/EryC1/StrS family aminotransferase [Clostridiales bacterium]
MIFIDRQGNAAWAMSDAMAGTDYIARLEARISGYGKKAVAMCSADAAIHTALKLCGAGWGDYVFVPTFTFYTNIATVTNEGCLPVFLDCDPETRCVSVSALETAFLWSELQDKMPKAVVVDDAFGAVADFDRLLPMCKAYGVPLIELACDAFGGEYNGRPCGACGDYGVISFAKRVDGGGGALILPVDEERAAREFSRGCYSESENHDYKMHNVIAALDCAKLQSAKKIGERAKHNLAALCDGTDSVAQPTDGDAATYALCRAARHAAAIKAAGYDVKTPPPVHTMPQYSTCPFFEHEQGFCVARSFSDCCLVDMDISAHKRRKLAKMLRNYQV